MLQEAIERKLGRVKHNILYELRQSGKAGITVGFHGEEGEALREKFFSQEKIKREAQKAVDNTFKHGDIKLEVAYYESNFLFLVLSKK